MTTLASERTDEPWRRRLFLPNYEIAEVARYAGISPQTVAAWHKEDKATLSVKEKREALTYMQLIEVAVVAAFRRAGISLKEIRAAREYVENELKAEYPFAVFRFKAKAKTCGWTMSRLKATRGKGSCSRLIKMANWPGRTSSVDSEEFEYEQEGIVIRWRVAGRASPVVIDPRLSFGTPTVRGTPTWVIKGRYDAGESNSDIAEDFRLSKDEVRKALDFDLKRGQAGAKAVHLPSNPQ